MKIKFLLFAFIFTIGCGQNNNSETGSQSNGIGTPDVSDNTEATQTCYVLCDFSASQGSGSRQMIMQNADTVFKSACRQGYKIKYYDITSPLFEAPFFEYESALQGIMKTSEIAKAKAVSKEQADTLHNRMIRLYQRRLPQNTCIITALNKVASSLARQAPGNYALPVKIVILSDMLEDCTYDSGRINIDREQYQQAFRTLARMPNPRFTFSGYKDIEITIVISSNRIINTSEELYNFWIQVFRKYGYNFTGAITTDLPGWLTEE